MELFPGLPNDLGRQCLLRVPYQSHPNLTAVCKSWKATVSSPQFYRDRKDLGTSQQCICLFEFRVYGPDDIIVVTVYDPLQGTWETLPALPHFPGCCHLIPFTSECVYVNHRLVVMGGANPLTQEAVTTLFIYDFSTAKWSRGADMPVARRDGALSASPEGLVYIAGGWDSDNNKLRRAAVYSVDEDEWKLLPDMSQERANCGADFIDGKFLVIDDDLIEVYDPKRGAWTTIRKEEGPLQFDRAAFSVGARSFSINEQKFGGVMEYDSKEKVWRTVCSLPETLGMVTSSVAWRDRIFVGGHAKGTGDEVFYMFTPPPPVGSEAGAQGETFGKWDAIQRPQHYHHAVIQFEATIEI